MLLRFLFLVLFFSTQICVAQNLVLNWSFESHIDCTSDFTDILVPYWCPAANGPEYFNTCYPESYILNAVPDNVCGHQYPYNGNAYVGATTHVINTPGIMREIIRGTLAVPLTIGTKYYVSFKTSMGWSSQLPGLTIDVATNKLGVLFTNIPYSSYSPNFYNSFLNNAQVYTNEIITDTTNWVTISGSFIADSAYQYLMLGNHFDNLHTDYYVETDTGQKMAYYYFDDVCVLLDSMGDCSVLFDTTTPPIDTPVVSPPDTPIISPPIDTTHYDTTTVTPPVDTFTMPSAFTPNGDNVNDLFQPVPAGLNIEAFRIYNRWGQKVFEASDANAGWDGKYKGEPQPADVYAYYIEVKFANGIIRKKTGSFTLLR